MTVSAPVPELVRQRPSVPTRFQRSGSAIWRFCRQKPLGAVSGFILAGLVVMAVFADLIVPYDALATGPDPLASPSWAHLAGTDQFGRDIFSRIIVGARTSLYVGVGVTIAATIPAIAIGVVSAYFGGTVDYLMQRVVDTIQAVPYLILLIAIMVALGPSLVNIIIALSFRRAITESRVMRGTTLSILNQTYVESARASGASNTRIMLVHLVPNIVPVVIVVASLGFGGVILAEASLSFLGYGIPPPTPSWGGMLAADGRSYMYAAPWMLVAPAIALSLVVFAINMFGDAIRDVMDPRLRGSR